MKRRILFGLLASLMLSAPVYAQDPASPDQALQISAENNEGSEAPQKSIYDYEDLKPRDIYNLALEQLEQKNFETAAEGFSRARDLAAYDNELRFVSAYNFGVTLAQKAASAGEISGLDEETLNRVIQELALGIEGFRDAVKQRPGSKEALGNLEITLSRLNHAKDVLAQKYNVLEKQLEENLGTERAIREDARNLSEKILQVNAEKDPLAFQTEFKQLARIQREALTQANLIADNLEREIELKDAENGQGAENNESNAFRVFQLKSASVLLETARQAMAGARSQLRDLSLKDALRLTNKAFNYLKQAREQLENPLSILGHIAEDEGNFVRIASAKHMFQTPELLAEYRERLQRDDLVEPPWLNVELLTDNQVDTLIRTNRLIEFLNAAVQAAAEQDPQAQAQDPQQKEQAEQQMRQIKDALPLIQAAASFMQSATQKLETNDFGGSVKDGSDAIEQLSLAMERFADLKHLIEIAYATESQISGAVRGGNDDVILSRAQQREILNPVIARNLERLERLADLLAQKASESSNQMAQAAQQDGGNAPTEEQLQQMKQFFEHAEDLRITAKNALSRMQTVVSSAPAAGEIPENADSDTTGGVNENLVPDDIAQAAWTEISGDAETAEKSLEELRILFFSVVEHIQELLRQQTTTMDNTTDIASTSAGDVEMKLPAVIDRQRMHEITSDKLSEVLKNQAEQIRNQGAAQAQNGQDPAETAQNFEQASNELLVASTAMRQVQADLNSSERYFDGALEQQKQAIEHIQKALELLQPPQDQQNQQNQQNQQQNQDQQDQQQKQQQQQKMSKEQMDKKIQQVRSREQERRRSKEEKGAAAGMDAVEKDW